MIKNHKEPLLVQWSSMFWLCQLYLCCFLLVDCFFFLFLDLSMVCTSPFYKLCISLFAILKISPHTFFLYCFVWLIHSNLWMVCSKINRCQFYPARLWDHTFFLCVSHSPYTSNFSRLSLPWLLFFSSSYSVFLYTIWN